MNTQKFTVTKETFATKDHLYLSGWGLGDWSWMITKTQQGKILAEMIRTEGWNCRKVIYSNQIQFDVNLILFLSNLHAQPYAHAIPEKQFKLQQKVGLHAVINPKGMITVNSTAVNAEFFDLAGKSEVVETEFSTEIRPARTVLVTNFLGERERQNLFAPGTRREKIVRYTLYTRENKITAMQKYKQYIVAHTGAMPDAWSYNAPKNLREVAM